MNSSMNLIHTLLLFFFHLILYFNFDPSNHIHIYNPTISIMTPQFTQINLHIKKSSSSTGNTPKILHK